MPKPFPGVKPRDADSSLRDAPIACHELDGEGNVVWINPAGCRLLGLAANQILTRPIWEFVAPGERDASRLAVQRKLSAELPLAVFERTYTRPDGSTLVLEIHEQYRRRANGSLLGIRSFMLDITARKQAEEELRKVSEGLESRIRERTQELELAIDFVRREMDERRAAEKEHRKLEAQVQYSQRMESMGVLAGGVAHKCNNLLTTILGFASLADAEVSHGSRAQEHLEQIIAAAGSAAELTQQMLAYSWMFRRWWKGPPGCWNPWSAGRPRSRSNLPPTCRKSRPMPASFARSWSTWRTMPPRRWASARARLRSAPA